MSIRFAYFCKYSLALIPLKPNLYYGYFNEQSDARHPGVRVILYTRGLCERDSV